MNYQNSQIQSNGDPTITEYHCCYLCGKELVFSYKTDEFYQRIIEQSSCENCGFKNKPKQFVLQ